MGAVETLASGLVEQAKSFVDPVVKLNKRQALTQGVNLGRATCCCINRFRLPWQSRFEYLRNKVLGLLLPRSDHNVSSYDMENTHITDW